MNRRQLFKKAGTAIAGLAIGKAAIEELAPSERLRSSNTTGLVATGSTERRGTVREAFTSMNGIRLKKGYRIEWAYRAFKQDVWSVRTLSRIEEARICDNDLLNKIEWDSELVYSDQCAHKFEDRDCNYTELSRAEESTLGVRPDESADAAGYAHYMIRARRGKKATVRRLG